jgi:hypothetical protein
VRRVREEVRVKALSAVLCSAILICSTAIPLSAGGGSPGSVTIAYELYRIKKMASNQIAVWIEDGSGRYVKTLYATRFTAEGGFRKRPQSLPEWVRVSNWEDASPSEVDAVSGATQKAGPVELVWDCTDGNGKPVPAGVYVYKIEGIVSWENRVVWSGRIEIGGARNASNPRVEHFPAGTDQKDVLLEMVRAVYEPAK